VKSKKFSVLPRRCLGWHKSNLVHVDSHAKMLEGASSYEITGWLQVCSQVAGDSAVEAGEIGAARNPT
jgi:hypothetical protein